MCSSARLGFEIELLAPPGLTRRDLAKLIAARSGGSVRAAMAPCTELGRSGTPTSRYSLRPAFDALDGAGRPQARLVDDVTILSDLDRDASGRDSWGRIVSPNWGVIQAISRHANASRRVVDWLSPLRQSHHARIEHFDTDKARAIDRSGTTLAVATLLPGERERVAEVVSPPLKDGHHRWLSFVLSCASELGFTVPSEAAVHVHLDGESLRDARLFQAFVAGFVGSRDELRRRVETNHACRALGPWPDDFLAVVMQDQFATMPWPQARDQLRATSVSKHCDLNVLGVLGLAKQNTVEFRFFPGSNDPKTILDWAYLATRSLARWTRLQHL